MRTEKEVRAVRAELDRVYKTSLLKRDIPSAMAAKHLTECLGWILGEPTSFDSLVTDLSAIARAERQ